jgi:predicted O-linked N-acetylglucosamine transferase (SPINDLY family)
MLKRLFLDLLGARRTPAAAPTMTALKSEAQAAEREGATGKAAALYRSYLEQQPDDDETWHRWSTLLRAQGRDTQALAELEAALAKNPRPFWTRIAIADIHRERKEIPQALASYQAALQQDPEPLLAARLHANMAMLQRQRGNPGESLSLYRQAVALDPGIAEVHYNLGLLLCELGLLEEAADHLTRAIEIQPDFAQAHSTLLGLTGMYRRDDPEGVHADHVRWAERFADPLTASAAPHANTLDPERPLTIGYVSGDFRQHSISYFIEPILAHHDRSHFRVHCYDNRPAKDAVSARLRQHADRWREISQLDDEKAAALIRADGVDILVDLSGHTLHNRLMMFARKPAPIQATWFGYMCTTGLGAMDYRITDPHLAPPGAERHYREKLLRLECAATFGPAPDSPPVGPLPALASGAITFGSFNNYSKISDEAVAAWAGILRSVAGSRLLLVGRNGDDPAEQERIRARFTAAGAPADSLEIQGRRPMDEFLRLLQRVDLALDPFPCTGGTTSLHTLWMGVPMVTLEGDTEVSRATAGMLGGLGLVDLIARTVPDYVSRTIALAGDLPRLDLLRQSLRGRMQQLPFMNSGGVTRGLENAFRAIWREYVARQRSA